MVRETDRGGRGVLGRNERKRGLWTYTFTCILKNINDYTLNSQLRIMI